MDFETALHNAVEEIWPRTRVSKCSFHMMQAIKKATTRIFGVTAPSKTKLTNEVFRLCCGFPYVEWDEDRVEQVITVFNLLIESAQILLS